MQSLFFLNFPKFKAKGSENHEASKNNIPL